MKYMLKKLGILLATLFIVSLLSFLAFQVIPGDAALSMLGTEATPERLSALQEELGLNKPLPLRFLDWLLHFVRGDMGTSYSYRMPVEDLILDKIPITLTLGLMSFLMILAISIPLGIYAARYTGRWADRLICAAGQVVMAVPAFFLGILFTYLFGLILRLFTPGGYVSYESDVLGFLGYLIVPAFAIALPKAAMAVRLLRASLLREMKKDYVRTAYSRGNGTRSVFYRHVLKNAVIPVITFLAMTLADILAGSLIIEQVFSIPGLGRMLVSSISNRDYPVVQAIIVCIAFVIVFINFLADLLYRTMDPRIRMR